MLDTHDEDGLAIRVLEVGGGWQSACYRGAGWSELVFGYHRLYRDVTASVRCPRHTLMLGGGGYSWPIYLLTHLPEVTVDVVEIDPQITQIARSHFGLDRLDDLCGGPDAGGRLRSFACDARRFLEEPARPCYDLIYNDCFSGQEACASLMDAGAARLVHGLLGEGGCYLTNVVSALEGEGAALLRDARATLGAAFSHVCVLPCGADAPLERDNNVVVASDAPLGLLGCHPLG